MMFLEPDTIPGLIANMQRCTAAGSYNSDCGGDGYRRLSLHRRLPVCL